MNTETIRFNKIYENHRRSVFNIAYAILKTVDASNDVTQEVFVKFFNQPEEKIANCEIRWLTVVARNTALKALNKNKKIEFVGTTSGFFDTSNSNILNKISSKELLINHVNPRVKMLHDEQQKICKKNVSAAIKKLPPRLRELIKLRFFKNLSYNQIAEAKNLSIGNVGFLLNRATGKLKKLLKNDRELLIKV